MRVYETENAVTKIVDSNSIHYTSYIVKNTKCIPEIIGLKYNPSKGRGKLVMKKCLPLEKLDDAFQLINCLCEFESRGIVHGDIKIENLVFDKKVKLIDYELIASIDDNSRALQTYKDSLTTLVSLGFNIDSYSVVKSSMFSLGITLCRLLGFINQDEYFGMGYVEADVKIVDDDVVIVNTSNDTNVCNDNVNSVSNTLCDDTVEIHNTTNSDNDVTNTLYDDMAEIYNTSDNTNVIDVNDNDITNTLYDTVEMYNTSIDTNEIDSIYLNTDSSDYISIPLTYIAKEIESDYKSFIETKVSDKWKWLFLKLLCPMKHRFRSFNEIYLIQIRNIHSEEYIKSLTRRIYDYGAENDFSVREIAIVYEIFYNNLFILDDSNIEEYLMSCISVLHNKEFKYTRHLLSFYSGSHITWFTNNESLRILREYNNPGSWYDRNDSKCYDLKSLLSEVCDESPKTILYCFKHKTFLYSRDDVFECPVLD